MCEVSHPSGSVVGACAPYNANVGHPELCAAGAFREPGQETLRPGAGFDFREHIKELCLIEE